MNGLPLFDSFPHINIAELCDDPDERAVARRLNLCDGAENAIKVRDLAALTGVSSRKVQSIVHHLIHSHGIPVGTSMREPYGNFLAITSKERQDVIDLHRRRGLAELGTAAALEGIDEAEYLRRLQTELEVEPA